MPTPAVIATSAHNYHFNSDFLVKMVSDLSPEEWLRRPDEKCNHIAWIVGHVVWTRKALLSRLGTEWSQPWLDMFARGAKCEDGAAYPSPDTLLGAWREVSGVLDGTLDTVSEETLAQPVTKGPPSTDGKESGIVDFLAIHETYHIGQASYLRGWLGHKGLMG
ncbi:MAG TPA: DinB family protein [Terracidiphilus sp.]|nr:DinB family protein [Terracidiphilus sp.]